MQQKLLTVSEVGDLCGLTRKAILYRISVGQLSAHRYGNRFLVPETEAKRIRRKVGGRPRKALAAV